MPNISEIGQAECLEANKLPAFVKSAERSGDTIVSFNSSDTKAYREGLEAVVSDSTNGLVTYYDTGLALDELKNAELYKPMYSNFYRYCLEKFNLSEPRVKQLIRAVKVTDSVRETIKSNRIILSEGICRELHKIKDIPTRSQCLKAAAAEGRITAKNLHQKYREMTLQKSTERQAPIMPGEGAVVRLATKHNPDLAHLDGYWGITKVQHGYTVAVRILNVLVPQIHPHELTIIKDGDRDLAEALTARLDKLFKHPRASELVCTICKNLSTRPYPVLEELDDIILSAIELELKPQYM